MVATNSLYTTNTATTGATSYVYTTSGTATLSPTATTYYVTTPQTIGDLSKISINLGQECHLHLPDGTVVKVEKDGSFEIVDDDAQVVYKANRIRNFNPFINASDKIEDFIRYCGKRGVRQHEMLDLPLSLFIGWLILEAAKADREPAPKDINLIPDLRRQITRRCLGCGRFMKRESQIDYCASPCFDRHYQRLELDSRTPDQVLCLSA